VEDAEGVRERFSGGGSPVRGSARDNDSEILDGAGAKEAALAKYALGASRHTTTARDVRFSAASADPTWIPHVGELTLLVHFDELAPGPYNINDDNRVVPLPWSLRSPVGQERLCWPFDRHVRSTSNI
jgi:hypothetical protein